MPVVAVGGRLAVILSAKTSWGLRAKQTYRKYSDRSAQGHKVEIMPRNNWLFFKLIKDTRS